MSPPLRVVSEATPENFDAWLVGLRDHTRVSRAAHNTAVVQFAALLDLCIDPVGILQRAGGGEATTGPFVARYPVISADSSLGLTSPTPILGGNATNDALRTFMGRTGDATFMEQRAMVGALAYQLRELQRYQSFAAERSTGVLILGIPAGYYVLTGLAALAVVAATAVRTWLVESAHTVTHGATTAQVGQDYAARLAVQRETGVMPPPSALEVAQADSVRHDADSFWNELGRGASRGVETGSKWLFGAAAVALLIAVSSSSSKGKTS